MKENRTYEAKESITNTFLKTVSAYANYGDGIIEFGIADDGTVVGIENIKDACLTIENKINDCITPVPDYSIAVNEESSVISLKVLEGFFKPYYYKAKAYKRNDTATIEVDRIELNRLIMEGEGRSYDELISKDQNLDFSVLEVKMKEQLRISSLNQDILKTIGLVGIDGRYNNAGSLLADQNSFSGIDCARFGETIDIILDRETFERKSILQQYDEVLALYRKYYQYDEIKGAIRKTIETIPEKAFRETIANALVHRTWDVKSHIRVSMYEDRIEVVSPGGLPHGISEKEYLEGQVSVLRNPIIGGVFFRLHLIESFGTGIQRINAAYSDSAVKPIHTFSENAIKVTLPVMVSGDRLQGAEKAVYDCLNLTGRSSSEIAGMAGYGKNKTLIVLAELERKGYVHKTGNGRGTKYIKTAR
jgi:ATP-dependent DNA helicase RecG